MISLDRLWTPAPANLVLSKDEVHVWCASLDQSASRFQQLTKTLSQDEQLRADRFRFEKHRQRFIIGRGVLRAILGRYMNIEPSQLRFCYGSHGKPALATASPTGMLDFNLSHSGGVALYAFARDRQIGIDIESLRPVSEVEQIADRFFSIREYEELRAFPPSQQHNAFFRYWTLKEAYVKATGLGLSLPLNKFEVSLAPGDSAVLLKTSVDAQVPDHWSLMELSVGHGYAAAIAVKGDSWRLKYWQWLT
ncbi:MAG: 4'-phosphopantetheinyl transferase superfamily protein [Stigonema ocellatum SAG 48.90 = DSM 106950]|nr:4'-phosphopantetheinyl transferase superfamily protein [Stigonema ocellatum SAG 48.90 = DSM 106950]